jgi:hypothetical protein
MSGVCEAIKELLRTYEEVVFCFQDALKRLCLGYLFLKMGSSVISFDSFNAFSPGYFWYLSNRTSRFHVTTRKAPISRGDHNNRVYNGEGVKSLLAVEDLRIELASHVFRVCSSTARIKSCGAELARCIKSTPLHILLLEYRSIQHVPVGIVCRSLHN